MKALNPGIASIPMSKSSMQRWVVEVFNDEKNNVRAMLAKACSKIHLSFDIWTSPNGFAILGVVAHFVRQDQEGFVTRRCCSR